MTVFKRVIALTLCVFAAIFTLAACGEQPHTHTPAAKVTEKYTESSCTQTGSYDEVVYCSECQEEISRTNKIIEKKAHIYDKKVVSDEYLKSLSTCTDSALYFYSCSCGSIGTESFDSGDALGHFFTNYVFNENATCEEDGTQTALCDNGCGKEDTITKVGTALNHTFGEASYTWENDTCTATRVCSRDSKHIETETVTVTYVKDTDKTCTTAETGHLVASFNNAVFATQSTALNSVVMGNELGHTYGNWVETLAPTCLTKGSERRDCKNCYHFETRDIDALGHDEVSHDAKAATCTAIGWNAYVTCTRCDYTTYVEIPAIEHIASDWIIDAEATYEADGSKHKKCIVCGETLETSIVPMLKHSYESVATQPTCTERGYTTHTCSDCGNTYVDDYLPATGHSYGDWVQILAPKCEDVGTERRDCSVCNHYETRDIAATGHSASDWIVDSSATCTTDGSKHKECTVCGKTLETYTLTKLGHNEIGHSAKAPTCTAIGWNAYVTCTRCDHTTYQEIAALGHDEVAHSAQAPSCTDIGWDAYDSCSRCNYTTYVEIPATGHTVGDWIIVLEPTCLEKGSKYQECSVCHSELVCASIEALGHDYNVKIEETTTCEKASVISTCNRCGDVESIIVEYITIDIGLLSESFNSLGSDDYGYYEKLYSINTRGGYGAKLYKYELFSSSTATKPQKTVDFTEDNTIKLSFTGYGSTLANYYYRVTVKDEIGNISVYTFDISLKSVAEIKVGTNVEHTPGNWIVDLEPTCTEVGSKYQECSVCHASLSTSTVDATGHTEGDWIIDLEPTCTEVGVKHKECVVCKEQLLRSDISSLGHVEGEWIIDLEQTCEESGSKHKTCAVCNQFLVAEIIVPHFPVDGFCKDCGIEFYTDGLQFSLSSDGTYYVIGYDGMAEHVVIPNTYNSIPVVRIISNAFSECNNVKSVVVPKSVKCIEKSAFYGCNSLEEITLPFIGGSRSATGAEAVFGYIFGYKLTENWQTVNGTTCQYWDSYNYAYNYYIPESIKVVTITDVTGIGRAFYRCSNLRIINIPNTVTSISSSAFYGCSSLVSIELPNGLTYIGESAFSGCGSLVSIELPNGLTHIGESAFSDCGSLVSIELPNSLTYISDSAFYGCSGLKNITIPNSVTRISSSAFYGCIGLVNIEIPNSVKTIGDSAFYGCSGLVSIEIPNRATLPSLHPQNNYCTL